MVWMEFTKVSPFIAGEDDLRLAPFPAEKKSRQTLPDYLYYANSGDPIQSSIPAAVKVAKVASEEALAEVKSSRFIQLIAAAAIVVTVMGLVVAVVALFWNLYSMSVNANREFERRLDSLERRQAPPPAVIYKAPVVKNGKPNRGQGDNK